MFYKLEKKHIETLEVIIDLYLKTVGLQGIGQVNELISIFSHPIEDIEKYIKDKKEPNE